MFYDLNKLQVIPIITNYLENPQYLKIKQYITKSHVIQKGITKEIKQYFELNDSGNFVRFS